MDTDSKTVSKPQPSPTQILQDQLKTLTAMHADQAAHNQRMALALEDLSRGSETNLAEVKIEDINMPFIAMVGLILKIAFASLPAAIIFGALLFLFWFCMISFGLASLLSLGG